jgi:hypothetical protein
MITSVIRVVGVMRVFRVIRVIIYGAERYQNCLSMVIRAIMLRF